MPVLPMYSRVVCTKDFLGACSFFCELSFFSVCFPGLEETKCCSKNYDKLKNKDYTM